MIKVWVKGNDQEKNREVGEGLYLRNRYSCNNDFHHNVLVFLIRQERETEYSADIKIWAEECHSMDFKLVFLMR